jgi:hypothetical protein
LEGDNNVFGSLFIERDSEKLSMMEVEYWKRMFISNLKVGVEIESNLPNGAMQSAAMNYLSGKLNPSNNVNKFTRCGIDEVKGDGSLPNGLEICTVGRRINFLDLYMQYRAVVGLMLRYPFEADERCGLHNHILIDYGQTYSSLEKPVPGVIFKNFVQLVKRHLPELVWITSTVCKPGEDYITRYPDFCSATGLIKTTPINKTVKDFRQKMLEQIDNGQRYQFINMLQMAYTGSGLDITQFHIELRYPDGSIYPAQIASQNILHASLILKAIELSEHGIISCGTPEEWTETKDLYQKIRTRVPGARLAQPIDDSVKQIMRNRALDMLKELKSALDQYDAHAYPILRILADTPISMLRREHTNNDINTMFYDTMKCMYHTEYEHLEPLIKAINMQQINGCYNQADWERKVETSLNMKHGDASELLFKLNMFKNTVFDKELGTVNFK